MKKGQIALFIILGVVILGGAAAYFYLQSDTIGQELSDEVVVAETVPIEF